MSTANLQSLQTEHDTLVDIDMEDYDYFHVYSERADRISYFEQFYLGDFSLHLLQYLRFYRRKKGKRAGKVVSIFVNPHTGKGVSQQALVLRYFDNPDPKHPEKLSLRQRINNATHLSVQIREHLYNHIIAKANEETAKTRKKLAKEKK